MSAARRAGRSWPPKRCRSDAPALRRVRRRPVAAPDEGRRLVGEEVGVEADPRVDDVSELAGADHVVGDGVDRVVREVVPDEAEDPRVSDRSHHLARLVRVEPEGLLAVDVLAGRRRGENHLVVQVVGRDDVDDIETTLERPGGRGLARAGGREDLGSEWNLGSGNGVPGVDSKLLRRRRAARSRRGRSGAEPSR